MCDLTEYLSDYILKDKKSSDEAAENIVYDFFHNLYHKYKATDLTEQDYKKESSLNLCVNSILKV